MTYELNDKINNLVPYKPISGTYDIRLDANECPLNYDNSFLNMVLDAVKKVDFNRYPDPLCLDLRKSFAEYYGINYKNVTVGNGSDELIFLIEAAFLKKGEKMLVTVPDFSMYEFYSNISENQCVKYIKNEDINIDINSLLNIINKEGIKLVIFSNPCNPTGQGVNKEDVMRLINGTDALIVLDEAYMDFWNEENSLIKDVESYTNLILFRTASKAMGSAALRLGFAIANENISKAIMSVKSPYNVNSISQAIGTKLYKNKDFLQKRTKSIVENTTKLYNELVAISRTSDEFSPYPTKTNFVFVKTSFGKELWEYLKLNDVVIRYMGNYIRITAGTAEEVDITINLIKNFISER